MIEWRDMPEFAGVDLEDSWVLGWSMDVEGKRLSFDVEASLRPGHPAYAPRPDEWTCYRQGTLRFEGVSRVIGLLTMEEAESTVDPDGSRDFGCMYELRFDGNHFRFAGDMGDVAVHATGVRLVLADDTAAAG